MITAKERSGSTDAETRWREVVSSPDRVSGVSDALRRSFGDRQPLPEDINALLDRLYLA